MLEYLYSFLPIFSSTPPNPSTSEGNEELKEKKPRLLDLDAKVMAMIFEEMDMTDIVCFATISKRCKKVVQDFARTKEPRAVISIHPQFTSFIFACIRANERQMTCFDIKPNSSEKPPFLLNLDGTQLPFWYSDERSINSIHNSAYIESVENTLAVLMSWMREVFHFETVNLSVEAGSSDEEVMKVFDVLGNRMKIEVKHWKMGIYYRNLNTTPLVLDEHNYG